MLWQITVQQVGSTSPGVWCPTGSTLPRMFLGRMRETFKIVLSVWGTCQRCGVHHGAPTLWLPRWGMKLFPAFASCTLAIAVISMTYAVDAQPGWSPKEGAQMLLSVVSCKPVSTCNYLNEWQNEVESGKNLCVCSVLIYLAPIPLTQRNHGGLLCKDRLFKLCSEFGWYWGSRCRPEAPNNMFTCQPIQLIYTKSFVDVNVSVVFVCKILQIQMPISYITLMRLYTSA